MGKVLDGSVNTGLWQCAVQGFGGLRMLGGKLRNSPNLPNAWKKLSCTLLWKGQKLAVTVTPASAGRGAAAGRAHNEKAVDFRCWVW